MSYKTSSPTVKCEKCEERLTDFEAYENHMAHMHGSSPSEESVVDWTLITDEDIITKDGNKYRVGGESINWSPNFDKEARIFLEEKYQKGKIDMLSKKKINEAKKFVKALEFDTNKHYDNLINKIEGKGEDSYNELFPNEKQVFPQNKMPSKKWFSHQKNQADVTDVIQDQGYFDDPNEVMGSQTKKFSKGKYHIDEPVAKEQFSTSFYGDYLGESKAKEGWYVVIKNKETNDVIQADFAGDTQEDALLGSRYVELDKTERVTVLPFNPLEVNDESKANESQGSDIDLISANFDVPEMGNGDQCATCGKILPEEASDNDLLAHIYSHGIGTESKANEYDYYIEDMGIENGDYVDFGSYGKLYVINHGGMGVDRGRNLWVTDSEFDRDELILQDFDRDVQSKIEGWYISAGSAKKIIEKGDGSAVESKANEGESVVNKHGVEYELDDEDDGLYNDLYYQQIDEGDEKEVFELLDKYNDNYPYASLKDMENEIERTIGWVSDDRDIQTLVLQWQDFRYS